MNYTIYRKKDNDFLEHALASIEKKRRISIENADKTDLFSNNELVEFMSWFDNLINLVKQSPPKGYVRTILIKENEHGQITSVRYELFELNEAISDTELSMLYENDLKTE